MAYPPLSVGTDFTDDTPAVGVHADRHNVTAAAVNDVVGELGPNPKGTFEHVDDRLTGIEGDVDTLRDLVLPPDPGALSDLTSFTVTSDTPDLVGFDFAESSEPSMQGGFGHYVVELSSSSSFTSPGSTTVLGPKTFLPLPGRLGGSTMPDLYFRIKAVDYYGNESAWLVHGASPPTPDPVTINTRDLDDLDITAADIRALIKSPVPLFCRYADVASTSTGGTEDDLYSDTIPAGQLANNGDRIEWECAVKFVAHATATRRLKFWFGGTVIFDSVVPTAYASGASYAMRVTITRVSASAVRCRSIIMGTNLGSGTILGGGLESEITGLTLANTQVAKCTGIAAGTGAASGDIVARSASITYVPGP